MNTIKRITVICFAVLVLAANLPLCASAVDPVSAATMANAMAQAITAYGASQGVSMTFDVANADGIGEGVHELWDQFVDEVNDPDTPTYDSLAVTIWSNLYSKIGNNLGINISASEMPYIDAFWNWLLSGPAEMQRIDDQYYEWTVNDGQIVSPVVYISLGAGQIPFASTNKWNIAMPLTVTDNNTLKAYVATSSWVVYTFGVPSENKVYFASHDSSRAVKVMLNGSDASTTNLSLFNSTFSLYTAVYAYTVSSNSEWQIPVYSSMADGLSVVNQKINGTYLSNRITVTPYVGDTVPQDVYIPDNEDVNYNPVDVAIPLDIPWDNTLFGDGSGVLTDAQSEAAAHAADCAITDSLEKTLTIADTENPSVPAPNEVYIPLLPVELPSFNFSLSGIWHYVVSWVQSLGAWLSLMFQTWAILPSAITIPVYATAVIVIVLGVYKRFFM